MIERMVHNTIQHAVSSDERQTRVLRKPSSHGGVLSLQPLLIAVNPFTTAESTTENPG
jgi:hypothetical protein